MKPHENYGAKRKDASENDTRGFSMSDQVSVDRKVLLELLIRVENALKEVQSLKKEIETHKG